MYYNYDNDTNGGMKMLKMYKESRDTLTFKLEGESEIEVNDFTNLLTSASSVFGKIVSINDKEACLNLKITAIREGSFEFDLTSIIGILPSLFENALDATTLISSFLEILKLKQYLKGKKIKFSDGKTLVTVNGDVTLINNGLIQNIFSSEENIKEIDKALTNFGKNLPERDLVFKSKKEEIKYTKEFKRSMEEPIVMEDTKTEFTKINKYTREVILKKVDFNMTSMWQVITDKQIDVTITDLEFKEYVISGQFIAKKGKVLKVDMEEHLTIGKNDIPIDSQTHYFITKVYPDENIPSLF